MVQLVVRVIPRASQAGVAGIRGGALLVRLRSAPVDGAANEELIQVIAKMFGVAKRDVGIASGERSKLKRVAIATIDEQQLKAALRAIGIEPDQLTP